MLKCATCKHEFEEGDLVLVVVGSRCGPQFHMLGVKSSYPVPDELFRDAIAFADGVECLARVTVRLMRRIDEVTTERHRWN